MYSRIHVGGYNGILGVRGVDQLLVEGIRIRIGGYLSQEGNIRDVAISPIRPQSTLSHTLEHVQRI